MPARRILILGGTSEAREIADRLSHDARADVISSLAGVTDDPVLPEGAVRQGGFGGTDGLRAYLAETGIDIVIDATHPFAETISRHAAEACAGRGTVYLKLERPAWTPGPGDDWTQVQTIEDAAAAIAPGAHALLTIGRRGLDPFLARDDITLTIRMISDPAAPLPARVHLIKARPPFALADEIALMRARGIDTLITKNAGGAETEAKLKAARELGARIIMIARPEGQPPGDGADVETMLAVVARHLA